MRQSSLLSEDINYYEIARYKLTWRVTIILLIILPILSIILSILDNEQKYAPLYGVVLALLVLFSILKYKTYKVAAKIYIIGGVTLNHYMLVYFPYSLHMVEPLWVLITIMYAFLTLGKNWGIYSCIGTFLSISYYMFFEYRDAIVLTVENITVENIISIITNFAVCFTLILYLINQFLLLNQTAETKFVKLTKTLKEKNNEKTVLLKEIHHRVKNNLQVIISLLRLQSNEIEEEKAVKPFKDAINRVIAMSLIHEKIYQSRDLAKIDFKDYIKTLALALIDSNSISTDVKFNIDSNITTLDTKSLVPFALIFNELISNSIKHGFEGQMDGKININITYFSSILSINYSDNGTWKKSKRSGALGLELIDSLTDQLSGTYKRTTENGTSYSFQFTWET